MDACAQSPLLGIDTALALERTEACAKALRGLAREEAALLLDRLITSGDPPTSAEVRTVRAAVTRFVESYRGVAARQAASEMFDALAHAPSMPNAVTPRPLGEERFARLGGTTLTEALGARAASGDADALASLVLYRFAWGKLTLAPEGEGGDARGRALVEWARHAGGHRATDDDVDFWVAVHSAHPFALGEALYAYARLARLSTATDLIERRNGTIEALRALAACEPERDPDPLAGALALLTRGSILAAMPLSIGRAEHALSDLRHAIELAIRTPERVHASARACIEGNARLAMAALSVRLDRPAEALRHAERAIAIDGTGPIGVAGRELIASAERG